MLIFGVTVSQAAKNNNKLHAPWTKKKPSKIQVSEYQTSVPKIAFDSYIRFFQKYLSPVDGPRCQLYPTCSQYGREAIRKHGAFLGFIMSADRLMRDNGGVPQHYSLIKKYNRFFFYDPLKNNDFWLLKDDSDPTQR